MQIHSHMAPPLAGAVGPHHDVDPAQESPLSRRLRGAGDTTAPAAVELISSSSHSDHATADPDLADTLGQFVDTYA